MEARPGYINARIIWSGSAHHADRALVQVEQLLLLFPVMRFHFAQAHDLPHDLGLEAGALGFGLDLADSPGDGRFLLRQALEALDEGFQPVRRNATRIRHNLLRTMKLTIPDSEGRDSSHRLEPGTRTARLWITWITCAACT